MKTFPSPLTPEEERYYLERLKSGDQEAKQILIERNMRLVAHLVKKYNSGGRDMEDLISIGTIGLIKAVNTFNIDKNNRLSCYASACIENEIRMLFRSEKKLGKECSLYEPLGTDAEGNSIRLVDILEAEEKDIPEQLDLEADTKKLYSYMKNNLTRREQEILVLRYGLLGSREYTQREIAKHLGISRSYVSRIEKKALEKLRCAFS